MSHPRENLGLWCVHNGPLLWSDRDVLIWYVGSSFLLIRMIYCSLRLCTCNALQFRMLPFWFCVSFHRFGHCYHLKVKRLFFGVCRVWWGVTSFRSWAPWVESGGWHWRDGACNTLGSNFVALIRFFNRFREEDVQDLVWSRECRLFRLTFNS